MLFMGEEWAASTPFLFFCDFGGDLAEAVSKGRREEFARFPEFRDPATRDRIPDPQAKGTFQAAKLKWDEIEAEPHRSALDWYKRILDARREMVTPLIPTIGGHAGSFDIIGENAVTVRWRTSEDTTLVLDSNLKDREQDGFANHDGRAIWLEGQAVDGALGPWTVRWTIMENRRGALL